MTQKAVRTPARPVRVFEDNDPDRVDARDAFLSSHRALPACTREFDRLADDVSKRATALGTQTGTGPADVRRAPGRCIVQLGPVALTISWVRSRTDTVSDGRLLIVAWEGTVAQSGTPTPERPQDRAVRSARPISEEVFVADATGEQDWRWRKENGRGNGHVSAELAERWVGSLATALKANTR